MITQELRLGSWRVRPDTHELVGPDGPAKLKPRTMAVLLHLARHAGEVRTREEVLAAVWGDAFVGEEVLTHCIWELRQALGDGARKPRFIRTIHRKGYQLIAPVTWLEMAPAEDRDREAGTAPAAAAPPIALRRWPSPELPAQPYPVLLPYTHPALLAGRDREIAELEILLRRPIPILGLQAPSGVGKSSLLLAGLVPALRAREAAPPVALIRHPHEAGIAARILGDLLDGGPRRRPRDEDWRGFAEGLAAARELAGAVPVLVLDQFEEVLRPGAVGSRAVLGPLLAATVRPPPGTREATCRWLLAYRQEAHGELVAWLRDVLYDARAAEVAGVEALPHDLAGHDRFHSKTLLPLGTPAAGGDGLDEAARIFQAVIEKPLAVRSADGTPLYLWRFVPGHAECLAASFAKARIARPDAPLAPEIQVTLAHLIAGAGDDGLIEPGDAEESIDEALEEHLRRSLEAAFPAGEHGAAVRRARALLGLRELAAAGHRRDRGIPVADLARAIGDDGERILTELATPLTRLVVFRDAPEGMRCALSHDRLAAAVVRLVDEEGRRGTLLVDGELLALRRVVTLKTALYRAREKPSTWLPRRHFRRLAAHAEALLWDQERRSWWAACRRRRRADRLRSTALITIALSLLAVVAWGASQRARQIRERRALLEQVVHAEPWAALRAFDELAMRPDADPEELLSLLGERESPMDVLEHGPGAFHGEEVSTVVLRTVERILPWVEGTGAARTPPYPVLIADLVWALDYGPGRDPSHVARARNLRDRVLAPLRRLRPPPAIADSDPDWVSIPAGTFFMGNPERAGKSDERPQHRVSLSAFRILRHEVTNAEYRRLVSDHPGDDNHPAASINWYQAYTYAAWLGGRLPTEAEWEYAARAGCVYASCRRDGSEATIDEVAWTFRNSLDSRTGEAASSSVMRLEPNPWGLYDTLGNLWEWTAGWYAPYPSAPSRVLIDPWGPVPAGGGKRVFGAAAAAARRTGRASPTGSATIPRAGS
ncbi:MAG: SUMF1/EgtB/PvdO family nonheme iron enzyme [Thermoanaerobaculia bacterium]